MTSTQRIEQRHNMQTVRRGYYDKISEYGLSPAWERLRELIGQEPKSQCVPAIWKFKDVRAMVMEAAEIISAEEAERRVLLLENPGLPGKSRITQTLLAGLQLIMPGEIAAGHRHTASAIRLVLDGQSAYTTVDGERTLMSPGDFVLTPNWTPHDHGNTTDRPIIWLDVLDVPMINAFETMFSESLDSETQPVVNHDGDSMLFYGSGILPARGVRDRCEHSPIVNYTYARMRPILEQSKRAGAIDKRHGAQVRYVNPLNGGWAMPTLGAQLALMPAGFKGEDYRATDGAVFVCLEGHGTTRIGEKDFDWSQRDIFVAPPWQRYTHKTDEESVLFSISDRPAQEALGIWREVA